MAYKGKTDFTPADRRLIAAATLPGVVWLTYLVVVYSLVPSACLGGTKAGLHAVTLVAALVPASVAVWSWRALARVGSGWPSDDPAVHGRSRLLAIAGIVLGAGFTLLTLATEIPLLILRPCD